uniref:RNase H type-1 domain-containing protein n=1 Tax=Cannabis sativa TaxID=3483 RepID=A0A803PH01_CANSA
MNLVSHEADHMGDACLVLIFDPMHTAVADVVVTIARHTYELNLPSKHRMMAQTKKTMRKALASNPHFIRLFATTGVEQARPLSEDAKVVEGDVEVQEIEDQGEAGEPVLVAGQDYVNEEHTEAQPLGTKGPKGPRWVSPPSVLTFKRLTNLFEEDLLGKVEAFLPNPGQLASNPRSGICACSGPLANLGFEEITKGEKFLGNPLIVSGKNNSEFEFIIEKISMRLEGWRAKLLSQAARTTLIKSVLASILIYTMSVFLLPHKMTNKIDGLRRTEDINFCLISKLGWMMASEHMTIWKSALLEKYCNRTDFLSSNLPASASPVAKGIWATRKFITDQSVWMIGKELKVSIWSCWTGGDGFVCDNSVINPRVTENVNVGDLMLDSGLDWNYQLISTWFRLEALNIFKDTLPFGSKLQSIFGHSPGQCVLCGEANGTSISTLSILRVGVKLSRGFNPPFSQNLSKSEQDEFVLYGAIVYHKLWSVKNDMFHNKTPLVLDGLRAVVEKCYQEHSSLLVPGFVSDGQSGGIEVVRWGLPRPDRVKCFVDYASAKEGGAVVAVFFDNDGFAKCFRAKNVKAISVLQGELEALMFGIHLACAAAVEEVDFFSDNRQLVQALVEGHRPHWNVQFSFNKLLRVLNRNVFSVSWILRESNEATHALARWA